MAKWISGHSAYKSAMAMVIVAIPVAPPLLQIYKGLFQPELLSVYLCLISTSYIGKLWQTLLSVMVMTLPLYLFCVVYGR
jgi:hypothetical protein